MAVFVGRVRFGRFVEPVVDHAQGMPGLRSLWEAAVHRFQVGRGLRQVLLVQRLDRRLPIRANACPEIPLSEKLSV